MKWGSHGFLLPVRRSASVGEEGFERVTDRLQIDDRQETSDLIAICHPFVTLAAHHAGMSQIDHLLGPHDDSSPARSGFADASGFDTPVDPDYAKSDERSLASGTLTISQAAVLLGVGRNLAYEVAARDGELAGVPVIRIGRRLLIPHARLLAVLGIDHEALLSDHHQ